MKTDERKRETAKGNSPDEGREGGETEQSHKKRKDMNKEGNRINKES